MRAQLALLPDLLTAHLQLSLVALLLGAAVSVPVGVWIAQNTRLQGVVLTIASIIQTIPSLALLALMVPVLAAVGHVASRFGLSISSIGYLPALIALCLYSMLPILRNTVTGLSGVDPALVEAALGVGMTLRQRLWRVEIPQALPTIVAGIRTAAVWVVGMTVLSTPVGAPSLGNYIFTGLQTRNFDAVLVGCVSAAILALFMDWLIRSVEVGVGGHHVIRFTLAVMSVVGLYSYILILALHGAFVSQVAIRVGAKTFTEQYILAEIIAQKLRQSTSKPVQIVQSLGSNVVYDALKNGSIDLYVDYSGTVLTTIMNRSTVGVSRGDVLHDVQQYLHEQAGAQVAARLGFENTYTLAMREADAETQQIRNLEQLALVSGNLSIAGDYEFFGRSEWTLLQKSYDLQFAQRRSMDPALMYEAIAGKSVDVIAAYTTDGRLQDFHLRQLQDPHGVIPPYDAIVVSGPNVYKDPQLLSTLRSLDGTIGMTQMQHMNYLVDHEHLTPAEVANGFIKNLKGTPQGLIKAQKKP